MRESKRNKKIRKQKKNVLKKTPMKINLTALDSLREKSEPDFQEVTDSYRPPDSLGREAYLKARDKDLVKSDQLAMDFYATSTGFMDSSYSSLGFFGSACFLGYATLSNLMQDGLMRLGPEVIADEMTRKWIKFTYTGEDVKEESDENDGSEIISEIENEFTRLDVQGVFNLAEFYNQFYGGCLVYIGWNKAGLEENDAELKMPLKGDQIKKGIKYLKIIEPINCYPGKYYSVNPLKNKYYEPETWWILGKEVHRSRVLYFSLNEAPVLLKPAYNFFGIPSVQMVLEYIESFTGSREAAVRLIRKFSLTYLSTDMAQVLQGGTTNELDKRLEIMSLYRDNDAVVAVDKNMEELHQMNTPLSGLTDIVRQTLEFPAMIYKIPIVKFLGISPGGMNATGESDLQNFNSHIKTCQEKRFRSNIQTLSELVQKSKGKDPDTDVVFQFVPLKEMTAAEQAEINDKKADSDTKYIDKGVVSQEEVRKRLTLDPDSGYDGLDIDDVPEAPDDFEPDEEEI